MIESVDINNFGSFNGFSWNRQVRDKGNNVGKFKKLNILYGKNYSGKTTLSRIIQSLQIGIIPEKYDAPSFSVSTSSGVVTHTQIPVSNLEIRVYNKDFVDANLSFLRDFNGDISSFAVIGDENTLIEDKINKNIAILGNKDTKTGYRFELAIKSDELDLKKKSFEESETKIKKKLKDKATDPSIGIKHNPLYKDPNYNIIKIEADIKKILSDEKFAPLSEIDKKNKEEILKEGIRPAIKKKIVFNSRINELMEATNEIISRVIISTKPIQYLLDDKNLQNWVKQGISYHKNKRDSCGFCNQNLPTDIWKILDDHFSEESRILDENIQQHISLIENEKNSLSSVINVSNTEFNTQFVSGFDEFKDKLKSELNEYNALLENMISLLRKRSSDIFNPLPIPEFNANSRDISYLISKINDLIDQNNKAIEPFEKDKSRLREEIRLSEVCQFIKDIDYKELQEQIISLKTEYGVMQNEFSRLESEIKKLEKENEELSVQINDEKKGAEKVNEYLSSYFGHQNLKLKAVEGTGTAISKFQIHRGDLPAFNLSEGECSLVSFCYFIAKLEEADTKGKNLIIYIDDPISSLDSNHIFFMFNLIESIIVKNNICEQLFISTHSLDFLKYCKKLSIKTKDTEEFIISGSGNGSKIQIMPKYLKKYVTEFNFLFNEIYNCLDESNIADNYHSFYNFGNNLRKFLEMYLFFKYPFVGRNNDSDDRFALFFEENLNMTPLVNRVTNEFSHMMGNLERCIQPIDNTEIAKLANFVLKKMKEKDSIQFKYLLESIEVEDPFVD